MAARSEECDECVAQQASAARTLFDQKIASFLHCGNGRNITFSQSAEEREETGKNGGKDGERKREAREGWRFKKKGRGREGK